MRKLRGKVSPGVVLGVVAIVVALSGTSIALPGSNSVDSGDIKRNAVRTADIKNGSVTKPKLRTRSVTSATIVDGSVQPADLAAGTVRNVTYVSQSTASNSEPKIITIDCGAGRRAIGGFYEAFDFGPDVRITVHIMRRSTIGGETGRGVQFFAEEAQDSASNWQMSGTAVCANI